MASSPSTRFGPSPFYGSAAKNALPHSDAPRGRSSTAQPLLAVPYSGTVLQHSESDSDDDLPPVPYIASMIAATLLQQGRAMFGRRRDADCILHVGDQRHFVHVQMLAARSPTLRSIFDEMIAHNAWQTAASPSPSCSSMGDSDEIELDNIDDSPAHPLGSLPVVATNVEEQTEQYWPCGQHKLHSLTCQTRLDPSLNAGMSASATDSMVSNTHAEACISTPRPPSRNSTPSLVGRGEEEHISQASGTHVIVERQRLQEQQSPLSCNTPSTVNQLQLQYACLSLNQTRNTPHSSPPRSSPPTPTSCLPPRDTVEGQGTQDNEMALKSDCQDDEASMTSDDDYYNDVEDDDDDIEVDDAFLPELTLELADPEGSCFEELLYWLYTNDGERWLSCFTPDNYQSILANIVTLNIADHSVLELCRRFEQQHPHLQGQADGLIQSLQLPAVPISSA